MEEVIFISVGVGIICLIVLLLDEDEFLFYYKRLFHFITSNRFRSPKKRYEYLLKKKAERKEKQRHKEAQRQEDLLFLEKIAELRGEEKKFPEMNEVWEDVKKMKETYKTQKEIKAKYNT